MAVDISRDIRFADAVLMPILGHHSTRMDEFFSVRHILLTAFVLALTSPAHGEDSLATKAVPEPNLEFRNGKIMMGKNVKGYIAFTFDDGPNPATTPKILAILERYEVPATFFVVGRQFRGTKPGALRGAKLLQEIKERGFGIGNHTTHHKNLSLVSLAIAKRQISENADALQKVIGTKVFLFRPPFGATNAAVRRYLRKRGDTLVRWNIDPRDFRSKSNAEALRKRVVQQILAKSGGILLLHDTQPTTAEALPGILFDLLDANCRRIKLGVTPILPVSLRVFFRPRKPREASIPDSERQAVHETRHRQQKHCNQKLINN